MRAPRIFISAGEASGDHYGALLIRALRSRVPDAEFFGLGGAAMRNAGCESVVQAEEIAVMGVTEVILHMPRIYGRFRRLIQSIRKRQPDLAVLIDFPDVNFRLARELKRLGVPVVYFVSPQLWAWKKRRIRWVRDRVTRMLVIFPFEQPYYRQRGVDAEFVGHPLADVPPPAITREQFARNHGLDPAKTWIGLLPGSRRREVQLNLPTMARAAEMLGQDYEFLVPAALTLDLPWMAEQVKRTAAAGSGTSARLRVMRDARAVLYHSRASVVASGTATVEAALIGNPFLVVYRLSSISYAVASRLVRLSHVGMVNLIAGRGIVPELIQHEYTPENLTRALAPLLNDTDERATMIENLAEVRAALRISTPVREQTAIDRAADRVTGILMQRRPELRAAAQLSL